MRMPEKGDWRQSQSILEGVSLGRAFWGREQGEDGRDCQVDRGNAVPQIAEHGLGLGPDSTIWGGELLLGNYHGFERRSWLKPSVFQLKS